MLNVAFFAFDRISNPSQHPYAKFDLLVFQEDKLIIVCIRSALKSQFKGPNIVLLPYWLTM